MSTKSSAAPIEIKLPEVTFRLQRCDDLFFNNAASVCHPIQIDEFEWWTVSLGVAMPLPHFFAALTSMTGPSGELYDPWKGAFAFPFKLTVLREGKQFRYLVLFANYRSSVKPFLLRVLKAGETFPQDQAHAPFEDEMTQKDFFGMLLFVYTHFQQHFRQMPKWTTGFIKEVRSNGILFGFNPETDEFFEQQYEDEDEYADALTKWREVIPNHLLERQITELDW